MHSIITSLALAVSGSGGSAALVMPSLMGGSVLQRCLSCNTPIFSFQWDNNGASLLVQARHHGEKHTSVIPISWLIRMAVSAQPEV